MKIKNLVFTKIKERFKFVPIVDNHEERVEFSKIEHLVVADIEERIETDQIGHITISNIYASPCRICRKEMEGYTDLESNEKLTIEENYEGKKIKEETITYLTEYYDLFGNKKNNNHSNKEEVYQKVKKLKQEGII